MGLFCSHKRVIVAGTKKKLSVSKGIVGGALLGPLGAVAGGAVLGKDKVQFVCADCGKQLDKKPFGATIVS